MVFLLCVLLLCRTWTCSSSPGRFCLQDVLTANPPVGAPQSGTLCSHCRSPSLSVCLHSSTRPRVGLFFYLVAGFADFRSDMTHNRPSVSEAFLRATGFRYRESSSCFSPTDGITYPVLLSSRHTNTNWQTLMIRKKKWIKQTCLWSSNLLHFSLSHSSSIFLFITT